MTLYPRLSRSLILSDPLSPTTSPPFFFPHDGSGADGHQSGIFSHIQQPTLSWWRAGLVTPVDSWPSEYQGCWAAMGWTMACMKYMLGPTHPAVENAHMAASTARPSWGGEKKGWRKGGRERPRGDGKGLSRACHIVPSSARQLFISLIQFQGEGRPPARQ